MKITIIGGGSYSWGPTFVKDILITPALRGSTITLHDIDAQRMDLIYRLGQMLSGEVGNPCRIEQTLSLDEALTGADAVILTITTGGLETMRADLEIPWKYGIRQSVGDTVGPGGISRALRNIPVIAGIARKVDEICPQALFLNYTNPLSTLTRTINRFRSVPGRTVGLCHEYHGVRHKLAEFYRVPPEQIEAQVAGINHLIWISGLKVDGRDVWAEIPALAEAVLSDQVDLSGGDQSVFVDRAKVKARLFQLYGLLPAAGDRHIAEFFSGFITEETGWGAKYGFHLTSVAEREALMAEERGLVEAALRREMPLAPFLNELSGEAAGPILAAVSTGGCYTGILNLPNQGQIEGLPRDVIVETFGQIDAQGTCPVPFGRFPAGVESVLARHIANQELTVEAALSGRRELALQALLNDPLTRTVDVDQVEHMLNELLEANKAWLPAFFA